MTRTSSAADESGSSGSPDTSISQAGRWTRRISAAPSRTFNSCPSTSHFTKSIRPNRANKSSSVAAGTRTIRSPAGPSSSTIRASYRFSPPAGVMGYGHGHFTPFVRDGDVVDRDRGQPEPPDVRAQHVKRCRDRLDGMDRAFGPDRLGQEASVQAEVRPRSIAHPPAGSRWRMTSISGSGPGVAQLPGVMYFPQLLQDTLGEDLQRQDA